MNATEFLVAARKQIADPVHWCRWKAAETTAGDLCNPRDREAVRWCALGALELHSLDVPDQTRAYLALKAAGQRLFQKGALDDINDYLGHDAVLEVFGAAIADLTGDA